MNRLRSLAGIALVTGLVAGLTSCASRKGDLGADLDLPTPAVSKAPKLDATAEAVEIVNAESVDLKNLRALPASDNRLARATESTPKSDPAPVAPTDAAKKDGLGFDASPDSVKAEAVALTPLDKPKPVEPKNDIKPEVAKSEPVKIEAAPVAPVAVTKKDELKVDVSLDDLKSEPKKLEAAPVAPVEIAKKEDPQAEARRIAANLELAQNEKKLWTALDQMDLSVDAGRFDEAQKHAAKVMELDPQNARAVEVLAKATEAAKSAAVKVEVAKAETPKVDVKPEAVKSEPVKVEAAPVAPVEVAKTEAPKVEVKPEVVKSEPVKVEAAPVAPVEVAKTEAPKADVKPEVVKSEPVKVEAAPVVPVEVAKKETPKVDVKPEVVKSEPAKIEAAPIAPVEVAKAEAPKVDVKPEVVKSEPVKIEAAPVAPVEVAKAEAPKADVKPEVVKSEPVKIEAAPVAKVEVAKTEAPKVEVKPEVVKSESVKVEAAPVAPVEVAKTETPKVEVKPEVVKSEPVKIEAAPDVQAAKAKALLDQQAVAPAKETVAETGAAIKQGVEALVAAVKQEPAPKVVGALDFHKPTVVMVADDDKAPAPPPVETPEQKAAKLAEAAARNAAINEQARKQEAEAAFQAGLKSYQNWEYELARKQLEKAVALDPTNKEASDKLSDVRSLLNIDINRIAHMITNLENSEIVAVQERSLEMAHMLEEGRALELRGSETATDSDSSQKVKTLADRLTFLEQARDRYSRILSVIAYLPPAVDLPGLKREVEEALARVRGKLDKTREEIDFNNRLEAQNVIEKSHTRETEMFKARIAKLLEQVKYFYDIHDYDGAEKMAERVLIADPLNMEAEKWKNKARAQNHAAVDRGFESTYKEQYRQAILNVDEAAIPVSPLIQYPADWDRIVKRTEMSIGKQSKDEQWKIDLRKKLLRKVSFEFVDTPLAEAIDFLRRYGNLTMIIDPKVMAGTPPVINLKVTEMNMDVALDWILKLAELEYTLQDNAIFISKPGSVPPPVEMRIYDVSDLTNSVPDFPGPEFQITVAGDTKGAGGAAGGANPFVVKATSTGPTTQSIADMIKARIRPDTWDAAQGTSIEERAGRLVVMQRAEVHSLIDQLLSNFRSTQKMMINIESRFLTIREAYLEDTGVEFQGLDPNILGGDFGDLTRLGAPTGVLQPRQLGSGQPGAGAQNLPFPGLVAGPQNVAGGLISEVGAVVNNSINFFPSNPDGISAQDTTNTVRQGGLAAQVTLINNTQAQAFIRALAVRENTSELIAPRLTVFNTQRASMFVARQQSYVADYEISGDSYDPVIRQFLVGVVLDVKPIVSSDRRYVTLELRPTVTELVNFVTRQIDSFTVLQGAQVNVLVQLSFPIQFPELAIRRVRTTCTVPDGGIMLCAGLYRNVKFHAENGIPFLSDLPVVGRLFRWNTVDNSKSNLAILVSPKIILFEEEEAKLVSRGPEAPLYYGPRNEKKKKEKCD